MEKKTYEILTDTFPARQPKGAGATIDLTEKEAKYPLLSGEIRLAAADTPKARRGKPGAGVDGEGA
ncbi:hypothetical protein [Shinella sp.]|uniref:hypothetical protein n=1 Tax=Shinella sp. TaxID=1870904 RepID=UPI00258C98E0|nr:hypothetical protein [Shinella sp.]MCW5708673.1 hypothetical protein [Shinella sp.]